MQSDIPFLLVIPAILLYNHNQKYIKPSEETVMKTEKIKMVSAAAVATLSNLLLGITSYADTFDTGWLTTDDNGKLAEVTKNTKGYIASVYGLVGVVCVGIAILCLVLIGLKFMRGGRKTEEAKDDVLNFLIGAVFVFGGVAIVTAIIGAFSS